MEAYWEVCTALTFVHGGEREAIGRARAQEGADVMFSRIVPLTSPRMTHMYRPGRRGVAVFAILVGCTLLPFMLP